MQELLSPKAVLASLSASSKKDILKSIAEASAALIAKDPLPIFDILWERERLGSTGVGNGIAIPHGRVPGVEQVVGFFARLPQPVDFESVDEKPVDLVFLLLAPEEAGADHLHALATISRRLRDADLCARLRAAKDSQEMYEILTVE